MISKLNSRPMATWCLRLACMLFVTVGLMNASTYANDNLPDGVAKVTEVEGISEFKLSNGVQVLLFPDESKPQFTINVTVLVGSRHEGYGETGMAHLLEHMLFKGTDRFDDIPALLKERGVLNMNGTTSYDRTNYYETLPTSDENLEFAIQMESDRLVNSLIRAEDLASEMTVVRSEFERGENSPQSILFQRIMSNAYEWHNYGKTTIGNKTDIMRVPVMNLRQFYKKFYQPDNIMVVLAGKFDNEKGLSLMEKYFGKLEAPKRELPKTYTEEPAQDGERIVVLRRVGDTQLVGAGYHVMSAGSDEYAAGQVLGTILGTEPSGPLYKNLIETELASSSSAMTIAGHDPGMIIGMAEVKSGKDLEPAKQALLDTMENLDESVITDAAVKRAVTTILKRRDRQFANSERFSISLSEWRAYGDWRLYFLHRDRLEKVTKDDVLKVAKNYLVRSNRTMGVFEPMEEPVRAELPSRPNLAKLLDGYKGREKIASGEAFEPIPELIESRTVKGELDSGIKYALLPKKTRGELVNLSIELNYGDEENLKGKVQAAQMLGSLMSRGTTELGFQEFKDRLDELSTTLRFGGGVGSLTATMQCKRDSLSEALGLMKQALRTPLLDPEQFDVVKRQMATRIESMKSDPQALAGNIFQRKMSPHAADNVRYIPTIEESIDRINDLSIDQVKEVHSKFLNGQHGVLAAVGDFETDAIVKGLNDVFADWTTEANFKRIDRPAVEGIAAERITVETPDKKNAIFIAGSSFALDDKHIDYEPLLVGDYILGGGPLASRLADRVRKQDGLSYGVGSTFRASSQDPNGTLMLYAISNPANTEKVVDAVDEELTRFLESGVTGEELEKAKESFLKTRQGRRAQDRGLARILLSNLKNDRTMDFQKESDERISGLDKQTVDEAIKRHFQKENLVIVTAGDFANAKKEDEAGANKESENKDSEN